jgi:hypothetical protein
MKKIREYILSALPIRIRFALRYMASHKRFSLLMWPTTFTEKNMLRIAKDRSNLLRTCADKVAMRSYIEKKAGIECLPKALIITDDPDSINWNDLPSRFVLKGSHGSGFVKIVTDFDASDSSLIQKLLNDCRDWLEIDYGIYSREWAYIGLPRKILIEEFVESDCIGEDDVPWDFKCFVFNGKCEIIQIDTGRFTGHRRNLYSPDWRLLECTYAYPQSDSPLKRPENLTEIIKCAELAGKGIDFVRVDIYSTVSGPLVGELTMTPGGGGEKFSDLKLDYFLGSKWKMPPLHD